MSFIVAGLFFVLGFLGVYWPSLLFDSSKLTPAQVARNKRIWRWGGGTLLILAAIDFAIALFSKGE